MKPIYLFSYLIKHCLLRKVLFTIAWNFFLAVCSVLGGPLPFHVQTWKAQGMESSNKSSTMFYHRSVSLLAGATQRICVNCVVQVLTSNLQSMHSCSKVMCLCYLLPASVWGKLVFIIFNNRDVFLYKGKNITFKLHLRMLLLPNNILSTDHYKKDICKSVDRKPRTANKANNNHSFCHEFSIHYIWHLWNFI